MRTMTAKYPGVCSDCGGKIQRGELIQWSRGIGARHAHDCQAAKHAASFHKCWVCGSERGLFRNLGAATPVWCDACYAAEMAKTEVVGNVRFQRQDQEDDHDEDQAAGFEPGTLANDRRMARNGITVIRTSSGHVSTQNSRGRCEDAPCCGCCT